MTDFGDLSGRSVLVTGAGRGLGRATANALARAGAILHLADIEFDRVQLAAGELTADGQTAYAHELDVSDEASVIEVIGAIGEPLWGVVNNAALADAVGGQSFWEIERPTWDRLLAVNLTGTWLVSKHAAPILMAQRAGRIVNLASDSALYGSPRLSHYIASKGGVVALTRAMARELGPHGVTVNTVAPGIVVTESTERVPAERHQLYADNRALARSQQPEDVVGIIHFLLSDAAGYLTGTTQVVDGGFVMA